MQRSGNEHCKQMNSVGPKSEERLRTCCEIIGFLTKTCTRLNGIHQMVKPKTRLTTLSSVKDRPLLLNVSL